MADFLTTDAGRRLAHVKTRGKAPGIVFLGGLVSDMEGTKALYLEEWAKARGQAFLRFDYSGHGQSSGRYEEGCIGDWADDAQAVIEALTEGPQILVGSSMGGWISLLMAKRIPERVAAIVGIAAAPDFTEDGMYGSFSNAQKTQLESEGSVLLPSDYGDPYTITRHLIEDGRRHLVLRSPLDLPFPARFLQGTADPDVPQEVALRLLEHAEGPDLRLTLVKGADHRFSSPQCLELIGETLSELLKRLGG